MILVLEIKTILVCSNLNIDAVKIDKIVVDQIETKYSDFVYFG